MRFKNKEMLIDQAKPGSGVKIEKDIINLDVNIKNSLNNHKNMITDLSNESFIKQYIKYNL